jgi:hypothetical protein
MTLPSFLLGCLIAMIFGCAYHFWRGGKLGKLVLFNLFAIIGFWAGHLVGLLMGWKFLPMGSLNLGLSIIFTILVLFLGGWLSQIQEEGQR